MHIPKDQSTEAVIARANELSEWIDRRTSAPAHGLREFARLVAWLDEEGVAFHDEVRCPESR
jgi:hypothetical protein